ncbi:mechanosensitive ion channel family protein [Agromyces sp. SYSU K20354]|uniref:mechanosensitive ion channel family protein n=1 Tax=Agromyces cavernae TaxID=2898659 RepID=UPI001E3AFF3E|nr:mechanosensitive ion channel domain-containing protein [Agromyces cavernae]MCD2441070.1 mechanosensitive ion channel family protein [Agromyces cavernae]
MSGWSLLFIVLTIGATWLIAWLARKGVRRVVERVPGLGETARLLAVRITGYAIWLIGIGVALGFLGASIQPLIAVAIIVGVVLVLVLRGVADNFTSGVLLQTRRPIAVGDEIESDGIVGRVVELNGRSVVVRTSDGQTVHLPNANVMQGTLVNNSAHGARRSAAEVRVVTHDVDVDELRASIVEAAGGAAGVHRHESVTLQTITRAPGRDVYLVQFWHHPLHGVAVRSSVVEAVAAALAGRSIEAVVTSDVPPAPLSPPGKI